MQIEISYRRSMSPTSNPCAAVASYQGEPYTGIGATWEEAKENLIKQLNVVVNTHPPEREMVNIPDKMDNPPPDGQDYRDQEVHT
jgi:hypothetical protein